jgi:hypothetical protein
MNIRPRRDLDGEIRTIPGDYLVIECEIYNPPSWANRKVYLFLDPTDTTDVLLLAREQATRDRSKTEGR